MVKRLLQKGDALCCDARIVEQITTFKALCDRLRDDARFRHNCGFDPYQPPPSPATFSRFLK